MSDITRRVLVRLPWDYDEYGLWAGDQRVASAVRASMAVPFFFTPVEVQTPRGAVTWVDGALLSNFPVRMFDRRGGETERWPTWGIKLSARPAIHGPDVPIRTPRQLAAQCLRTALDQEDSMYRLDDEGISRRTIYIDTADVATLDFGLDRDARELLLAAGRDAARTFLQAMDGDPR